MLYVQNSLKFWLEHGVDGFRFYGVEYLVESDNWTQADTAAMVCTECCLNVDKGNGSLLIRCLEDGTPVPEFLQRCNTRDLTNALLL